MYLSQEQNSTLLQEMAELSSCGSMFLMSVVPAENIGVQRSPGSLMSTWKWGFPDTFIEVCTQQLQAIPMFGYSFLDALHSQICAGYGGLGVEDCGLHRLSQHSSFVRV